MDGAASSGASYAVDGLRGGGEREFDGEPGAVGAIVSCLDLCTRLQYLVIVRFDGAT